MNGENRRSREAVRNSIRTYGVKVMDPASLPLKKTGETDSRESVSRFSERSLHSHYNVDEGCCRSFLTRIPYATLLAFLLCILGILIFGTSLQRFAVLTSAMISTLMNRNSTLVTTANTLFLAEILATVLVSAMILVIGILATGDTRTRVYGQWKARIGGRLCCAILMICAIVLFFTWMGSLMFFVCFTFFVVVGNIQCTVLRENINSNNCLHLPMLNTLFPGLRDEVIICNAAEVKSFCKDFVEKVYISSFVADFGMIVIIFSLVLYLICLGANYARIRCQAKFQELEELRHLDGNLQHSKDRF